MLHVAAAAIVVVGVLAQVFRSLAPPLGDLVAPSAVFDADHLQLAAAFRRPLYVLGAVALLVRLAIAVAAAATPTGRRLVDAVVGRVGERRPARAFAAAVLVVAVATDLVLLPIAFWSGFVHEGAYGLRTQGLAGWAYDWMVGHLPVWLGVGVLALGGFTLARRLPRTWPAVGGMTAAVLGAAVAFGAPLVLEPLRFDLRPLPDGPVRAEVEAVLERAGEPVDRILVADASRRTTRQNAYVSGLGSTRRVVLYDTLVADRPADEVGVVLAHELGHDRNRDVLRSTALSAAGAIVTAYAVRALLRARVRRGLQSRVADPRAAAVVVAAIVVLTTLSLPLQSFVSRRAEAAADLAALNLTADPATFTRMQVALTRSNLGEPAPPRWAAVLWASHPAPVARLTMAMRWPLE